MRAVLSAVGAFTLSLSPAVSHLCSSFARGVVLLAAPRLPSWPVTAGACHIRSAAELGLSTRQRRSRGITVIQCPWLSSECGPSAPSVWERGLFFSGLCLTGIPPLFSVISRV